MKALLPTPWLVAFTATVPLSQEPAEWRVVSLPALARPTVRDLEPLEWSHGVHLPDLDDMDERQGRTTLVGPPRLPVGSLLELLYGPGEERLRIETLEDRLLLTGEPEEIERAVATLVGVDELDDALAVEVVARLTAGGAPRHVWRARAATGRRLALGERRWLPYVGDYDADVATDSAVGDPEMLAARLGEILHLTVHRLQSGALLFEGHLDLAQLASLDSFDPDHLDLGVVEIPDLVVTEVVFSGVTEPGGTLVVELSGLPLDPADWRLEIEGSGAARPGSLGEWTVHDLSALASPAALAGRLPENSDLPPAPVPLAASAIAPSALAALIGDQREAPRLVWTDSLLFVPTDRPDTVDAVQRLVAALEEELGDSATLIVSTGGARASLPCVAGRPVRLIVGHEVRRVRDFRVQIAPETWLPSPTVHRLHAGLALEGVRRAGRLEGRARLASFTDGEPIAETATRIVAIQRVEVSSSTANLVVAEGGTSELFDARVVVRMER